MAPEDQERKMATAEVLNISQPVVSAPPLPHMIAHEGPVEDL